MTFASLCCFFTGQLTRLLRDMDGMAALKTGHHSRIFPLQQNRAWHLWSWCFLRNPKSVGGSKILKRWSQCNNSVSSCWCTSLRTMEKREEFFVELRVKILIKCHFDALCHRWDDSSFSATSWEYLCKKLKREFRTCAYFQWIKHEQRSDVQLVHILMVNLPVLVRWSYSL